MVENEQHRLANSVSGVGNNSNNAFNEVHRLLLIVILFLGHIT